MPRTKQFTSSLSDLIDSPAASSDGEGAMEDSNQENTTPPRRGRGRAKAGPTRKTKPASKRLSAGKTHTAAKRVTKRAPLKDSTNAKPRGARPDAGDDLDEARSSLPLAEPTVEPQPNLPEQPKPKRKGRPRKVKEPVAETAPVPARATVVDDEFEYTPTVARTSRETGGIASTVEVVRARSTAEGPMYLDEALEDDDLGELPGSMARQVGRARSNSLQPRPAAGGARRRAGSTSEAEGTGEPELRRKLGEMTKKFEGLDTRYRSLRDVGVKEAEANFEKLKRHSEERSKVANDLIASLREELSTTKQAADEGKACRSDLHSTRETLEATESRVTELMDSLTSSQNEIKALHARLAATRAAGATVETVPIAARAQGAANGKGPANRTVMVGSAEAARAAQAAQMKENMYSDLTGLIMRNVDRLENADVYDCIQTGRNGTLHFKLSVPVDLATSYDEAEIQYLPMLDGNRDRDLLEILPDYLQEEISFSNSNAAKFYSRVVDTLTRRQLDE